MTREITSPGGDTLTVYSDADLLDLFSDLRSNSVALLTSYMPRHDSPRGPALAALWHEGKATDRRSGRASRLLRDRALRYGLAPGTSPAQVSNAVTAGAFDLFVERDLNAKTTYEIRLVGIAERWLPDLDRAAPTPTAGADSTGEDDAGALPAPEPEPVADDAPGGVDSANGHRDVSADVTVPEPAGHHHPIEFELTNAVATALLTQVVEIIATGQTAAPELGRLQLDVQALEERLGVQVSYVDKLRRQLREAGDEIVALKVERDGLRQRLRSAEHNLRVATGADAARIIDMEVQRQVDRIMRERPSGAHSKMAVSA